MAIQKVLLKNDTYPDGMYPQTRTDCVFDENGNSLDTLLDGPELLWTNPSPTAAVGEFTATFDHSGYRFLMISYKYISNSGERYNFQIVYAINGYSSTLINFIDGKLRTRASTITSTGVSFSTGYFYNSYGGYATDTYANIPYQIYGVK